MGFDRFSFCCQFICMFTNPHFQTCFAPLFRSERALDWHEVLIQTRDQDELEVHLAGAKKPLSVILFVHGLEGNYRSPFFASLGRKLMRKNWGVSALSLRGSDLLNPGPKLYTAGDSDDLDDVLFWLNKKYPNASIHVLGISLGANIVGKYLGERGKEAVKQIRSAVLLSPPVDLYQCSKATRDALFGFYDRIFLGDLQKRAIRKMKQYDHNGWEKPVSISRIQSTKTMMEFDDVFTAVLHGFNGMRDYYAKNSCGPMLHQISVPTLIATAMDDPLIPIESFPIEVIKKNPNIEFKMTRYGGHLGWVNFKGFKPNYWMEEKLVDHLLQQA